MSEIQKIKTKKELYLILYNIRSAYNVGAIFRTADGAGVKKIYLTGYTPTPFSKKYDFYPARAQKQISKTALGAEKFTFWKKEENIDDLIKKIKSKNVNIVALEQGRKSKDFRKVKYKFPCAMILGNEVNGIEKEVLDKCDIISNIPMRGKKESLNVSVAGGIAIYEILK